MTRLTKPALRWSDWHELVEAAPLNDPGTLTRSDWAALDPDERAERDALRREWNTSLSLILTPDARRTHAALTCQLTSAGHGGAGVIVTGDSFLGKTSIVRHWAARLVRSHLAHGLPAVAGMTRQHIPVVLVETPENVTRKSLSRAVARFLEIEKLYGNQVHEDTIFDAAVQAMERCGTVALLIDEANRARTPKQSELLMNFCKDLMDRAGLLVVVVGAGIQNSVLVKGNGSASSPVAHRSILVELQPVPFGDEWRAAVATWEQELRLLDQRPGDLVNRGDELWHDFEGRIGAFRRWLLGKVLAGQERIE